MIVLFTVQIEFLEFAFFITQIDGKATTGPLRAGQAAFRPPGQPVTVSGFGRVEASLSGGEYTGWCRAQSPVDEVKMVGGFMYPE